MECHQAASLSLAARFELERHYRLLDQLDDVQTLRNMAKLALGHSASMKAMLEAEMRRDLPSSLGTHASGNRA